LKIASLVFGLLLTGGVFGADEIYTALDPAANGGITGALPAGELTLALAVDSEWTSVYRATIEEKRQFRFENVPVGKYDLVLVTKPRQVLEGLQLGGALPSLPPMARLNLETRIAKADSDFNRSVIHRSGMVNGRVLALVERICDRPGLPANIRQLEVLELLRADNDWKISRVRRIYRQTEPPEKSPVFLRHAYVPALNGIRVVANLKELGKIPGSIWVE